MTTPSKPPATEGCAETGSLVICNACHYSGSIDTFLPSMSINSDCRCPKCKSTDNNHNDEYRKHLRKAWSCKHSGTLINAGTGYGGCKLLECTECGSVGLDWSMRKETPPLNTPPHVGSASAAANGSGEEGRL